MSEPGPAVSASGSGRLTINDVAKAAQVSPMTVSRSFRDPGSVKPETRDLVLRVCAELGYVPSSAASSLSTSRSRIIAYLIPNFSVELYHSVYAGLVEVLEPAGYQILVGETHHSMEREERVLREMLGWRPAACILAHMHHAPGSVSMLKTNQIATCELFEARGKFIDLAVGYSNKEAGYQAGLELVQSGCKQIFHVCSSAANTTRNLSHSEGLRSAAAAAKVKFSVARFDAESILSFKDGARFIAQIDRAVLRKKVGVFFSGDTPAAGALWECQRLGYAVPDRIRLIGFGNSSMSETCEPALSSIAVHPRDMGRSAGRQILSRLNMTSPQPRIISSPFQLVVRRT